MENKIRLSQMKTADTTHGNFCKRDQALFQYCGSGANYEHRCQVLLTSIMGTLLWNMKEKVMFACYQTCIKVETIHGMRFPEGTVAAFSIPGRHHKSYTDVILATEAASTSSFLLLMVIHQATSNRYLAFFCSGMIQTISHNQLWRVQKSLVLEVVKKTYTPHFGVLCTFGWLKNHSWGFQNNIVIECNVESQDASLALSSYSYLH